MAYRQVDAVDVISGTADLCGLDRVNLATADFSIIRQAHDRRLQTAWEFQRWPDLLRVEKRYYRDLYATGTAYTASTATSPTEVYFPATGKYYQNVKASTGVDPANSAGVVNATNWAESATSYSASNFSSTTTYAVGNIVFYPTTDRFYIAHTTPVAFAIPTVTTYWGILTEFDRYIAYAQTGKTAIGNVFSVDSVNPKTTTRSTAYSWWLSENGIQVATSSSYAWVTYRLRTVHLFGDVFVATTAYTVGQQIYYSATGTRGNYYDCIIATSAGDTPVSQPTKWSIVSIPLIFQRYLEYGGYSDYLRYDGQAEKAGMEDDRAQGYLNDQAMLLVGQQGQEERATVSTR
jgi:hypothetical protein